MGAVVNGMAAHGGVIPFAATFLVFSDYMRPPIRLAALMRLPRDLRVHARQHRRSARTARRTSPIEHIAALRAIPNLIVIRPADANETAEAWRAAIENTAGPTALVLTRQNVPTLDRATLAAASGLRRGGYVLSDGGGVPDVILIATGSEVSVALAAAGLLRGEGRRARVVSLPSWELFAQQPQSYRDEVLPPAVTARVSVEAASPFGWERYTGTHGRAFGLDGYGDSAPGPVVMKARGFTPENIAQLARDVLG